MPALGHAAPFRKNDERVRPERHRRRWPRLSMPRISKRNVARLLSPEELKTVSIRRATPLFGLGRIGAVVLIVTAALGLSTVRPCLGQEATLRQTQVTGTMGAKALSSLFRAASEAVLPTVVKIRGENRPQRRPSNGRRGGENPFRGTPFEDFFEDGMPFQLDPDRMVPSEGLGSGVIIGSEGLVLTNNHVVRGFDRVIVELSDGRTFDASEIRTDADTDLAVLTIKGAGE